MSDAINHEIYQELYAIRSRIESMDMRSEVSSILQELQRINVQLEKLTKALTGSSGSMDDAPSSDKKFGFL